MFGRDDKVSGIRLTAAQYIILAVFLVLAYRLWQLQVMRSDYYSLAAERNHTREIPVLAPRGKILDRNGRTIVDNYPSFTALLLRDSSRDLNADADLIARGLHLDPNEVRARVRHFATMPQYQPIFLKEDITPDDLQFIDAHRNELPELDTIMSHRRLYPRNGFMAHLIGYVGEVSEDMPGKPLQLTIDIDLQIAAEETLQGKNGAIVAMDPRTGEILAMVSGPTFDPNSFAVHVSHDEWNKLLNDPEKPLLNKAIQAQLAPGSTFKVIMSVAGWQEGIAQTLHVNCTGSAEFYGRRFGCHLKGGHGQVDLEKGIYESCDVFFYTLAEKLGIEKIAKYATMLGLGQKTGIDLPNEASGVVPSEEWKIRNFKQKWFAGETISVGIGQGALTVTPVQLLRAVAAVSMGWRLVVPHVVKPDGLPPGYVETANYTEVKSVPIDPTGWELITDALVKVLQPGGTAPSAAIPGIEIAGKTGSAQIVSLALRAKHKNDEDFAQNGWFVGFTPRRNPDVVVCVLFQGGEHGKLAARLATQVIKAYVEKQRRTPQKMVEKPKGNGTVDIGALWTEPDTDGAKEKLTGGRFILDLPKKPLPAAIAAPGMTIH